MDKYLCLNISVLIKEACDSITNSRCVARSKLSYGFKMPTFPKLILCQEVGTAFEERSCSVKLC